ncbi:MAG: ion channel [Anaerolineae bacterium]|nr:potassium channel family protein [Candidatus Roseilinea sp.]MDW8451278.1 ion channel [Anaerolineae bacterium]
MIPGIEGARRTPANAAYDLFITAASMLAIANVALIALVRSEVVDSVIFIIELFLSAVFFLDFLRRLRSAVSAADYFLRGFGWADLLSSVPFPLFNLFRLFFLARAVRVLRAYGLQRLQADSMKYRATSTLLIVFVAILLLMEFGGMAIVIAERDAPNANIKTGADAIWWIMVTIATVGYGDRYPVTLAGRLIGMAVMIAGVGVFGAFSGFLANFFLSPRLPANIIGDATPNDSERLQTLAEVQRLLEEHEKSLATLKAKLADLRDLERDG